MRKTLLPFLTAPALYDFIDVQVCGAVFPHCVEVHIITVGHGVRNIELNASGQRDSLPKY